MILVIAPSKQQFDYFLYTRRRIDPGLNVREFAYVTNEAQLLGFYGDLIIVNGVDCASALTEVALARSMNELVKITYVTT